MSNVLYDKCRERFATKQQDWTTDVIKAVLVDTAVYTVSAAHQFLSSVPSGARISGSVLLTNRTATGGACDADDTLFQLVSGPTIEAVVIYEYGETTPGVEDDTLCKLIAYIDSATGLPITPNGGDIIVTWDNGVNKIFRI
jgi:hypothetical protein